MKRFCDWIETILTNFWLRAEDASDNNELSLATLRILYGIFLLFFETPSFTWISQVPQSFFNPPLFSLANFFENFPGYFSLLTIDIALIICSICLLLGIKARYAGVAFSLLYVFGSSFSFSFGKINHGSIMFIVFLLGLSFTNWGVNYAVIKDKIVSTQLQRRILAILAVLLCFAMFTAGFMKAIKWIDFNLETGGFLAWFYEGYFNLGRQYLLAPLVLLFPPQVFEIFDYTAVVFELSPFIALVAGRKWWQLWLLVASIFHLANTLLLNISFNMHTLVYLCFIPISFPFVETIKMHFSQIQITLFISAMAIVVSIHRLVNNSHPWIELTEEVFTLYIDIILWTIVIGLIGFSVAKNFYPVTAKKQN